METKSNNDETKEGLILELFQAKGILDVTGAKLIDEGNKEWANVIYKVIRTTDSAIEFLANL